VLHAAMEAFVAHQYVQFSQVSEKKMDESGLSDVVDILRKKPGKLFFDETHITSPVVNIRIQTSKKKKWHCLLVSFFSRLHTHTFTNFVSV
jgi:hypothetical protein